MRMVRPILLTVALALGLCAAAYAVVPSAGAARSVPRRIARPVVSGTVATGRVLRTTTGRWTGHPTSYRYQWRACSPRGASCVSIRGATGRTYTVRPQDAGHTLEAVVTARNARGSASAAATIVPLIDDFSGANVDRNVWAVPDQQGDTSNDEQECYAPSQVSEGAGVLKLRNVFVAAGFRCPAGTPSDPACTGACAAPTKHYLSGAVEEIRTAFAYGRVVVRAKLLGQPESTWPAIWLLGAKCQRSQTAPFTWLSGSSSLPAGYYCPWSSDSSDSAEIDIAEGDTGTTSTVRENVYNRSSGIDHACVSPTISDYSTHFHAYEVDWSPGRLVFRIDGKATGCGINGPGVPSHPMFLVIDAADQSSPTSSDFPDAMTIDYVHVSH